MAHAPLPILLIHGLIGTLRDPALLAALPCDQALAPDLLGYGTYQHTAVTELTLAAQVDHLHHLMHSHAGYAQRWHVLGHAMGGVIAALLADTYPENVASVVSVEGHFTLEDANWSQTVATQPLSDINTMLEQDRAGPITWLLHRNIEPDTRRIRLALRYLEQQPADTVQAMARAVVECTRDPGYLRMIGHVLASMPLHLVAGESSRADWHVPAWVCAAARSQTVIPNTGHLMMLEEPIGFGVAIGRLLETEHPVLRGAELLS